MAVTATLEKMRKSKNSGRGCSFRFLHEDSDPLRDETLENVCSRKMIADIFGESGDEEEEEFTVSSGPSQQMNRNPELLQLVSSVRLSTACFLTAVDNFSQ